MLTKILHSHIDEMDKIEQEAQASIDSIIQAIDIKELMKDPAGYMHMITEEIRNKMVDDYIAMASKQGFHLGQQINKLQEQDKTIPIDGSKDPTENEAIV